MVFSVVCQLLGDVLIKLLGWGHYSFLGRSLVSWLRPYVYLVRCFNASQQPQGTKRELAHLLTMHPLMLDQDANEYYSRLLTHTIKDRDLKWWCLTLNGRFSIKSFYRFLNNRGLRCQMARHFQKSICPKKIDLFNWLAWKNKILTLKNLAKRRYNTLPTTTCIMCHSAGESVVYLFLHYNFAEQIWGYFGCLLQLPDVPSSLQEMWSSWRLTLRLFVREFGDLLIRAITQNIWIERNTRIFNDKSPHLSSIMLKIVYMLVLWFFVTS